MRLVAQTDRDTIADASVNSVNSVSAAHAARPAALPGVLQHVMSTRSLLCVLALCTAAMAVGCAQDEREQEAAQAASVTVHPRLVMDGLVDLAAREHGHVQVTEVVFHAPEVAREDSLGVEPLVGPGIEDNLVFRYAIGANDGLGAILGGERQWRLGQDGELAFQFAPAEQGAVDALSLSTGVDLGALVGQTAFVRGTIAVERAAVRGFACGADLDGDPDTSPADCGGFDDEADSDPDTSPADEADGDPDTSPADEADSSADAAGSSADAAGGDDEADSDPDTAPADSDPDTAPADSDPDTAPADSDPDTSPARSDEMSAARRRDDAFSARPTVRLEDARTVTHVPFLLVIKDSFSLHRPVAELRVEELSPGEVLPIDLRVDMDALFSPQQIEALDRVAQGAGLSTTVVVEGSVDGAVRLELDAKAIKKAVQSGPGIRVTGDLR
jgi:hypothetical protein